MKSIYIPGVPDTKMRHRTTKRGHVYDPNAANKEASIQKARLFVGDMTPYHGPLYVSFIFIFPRPKSHYGTGKNANVLKPHSPEYCDQVPKDVDNMEKFYCDSFNCIHYPDDKQIIKSETFKRYASGRDEMPHVWMSIYRVPSEAVIDERGTVTLLK
jgi:Holliday junction resolvase RusA-like endonuclease